MALAHPQPVRRINLIRKAFSMTINLFDAGGCPLDRKVA
jgi:hypothetical protein